MGDDLTYLSKFLNQYSLSNEILMNFPIMRIIVNKLNKTNNISKLNFNDFLIFISVSISFITRK